MKISFSEEILECFEKQYPEKIESYKKLVMAGKGNFKEQMNAYDDMMETFPFLIKLIIKLSQKIRNRK